jgi:hypothetical protein
LKIEKVEAVDVKEKIPALSVSLNQNVNHCPVTNIEYTIGNQSGSEINQSVFSI